MTIFRDLSSVDKFRETIEWFILLSIYTLWHDQYLLDANESSIVS